MGRKFMDCREIPSEMKCSVRIEGTEDEVLRIATRHAIEDHGEKDSPEFRQMLRSGLHDLDERRFVKDDATETPAIM